MTLWPPAPDTFFRREMDAADGFDGASDGIAIAWFPCSGLLRMAMIQQWQPQSWWRSCSGLVFAGSINLGPADGVCLCHCAPAAQMTEFYRQPDCGRGFAGYSSYRLFAEHLHEVAPTVPAGTFIRRHSMRVGHVEALR